MKAAMLFFVLMLSACAGVHAPPGLNEEVPVKLGETKQIGPDGLEITLHALSANSGCPGGKPCSSKLFQGTIGVRMGEAVSTKQVGAILKPGTGVRLQLDGYVFYLVDVRQEPMQAAEAVFLVLGYPETVPEPK